MAEAWSPLLPWRIVAALVALLVLEVGREIGWSWDVASSTTDATLSTLDTTPARSGGDALLILGNSRVGFAMQERRLTDQVGSAAGIDGPTHLVFGPELVATTLEQGLWRLVAYHPSVVVVQIDLLFPLGPKRRENNPVGRLLAFERSGPDLEAGLQLLSRLWWARRVVLEVPMGRTMAGRLGASWWAERRALHDRLRALDLEVLAEDESWPDPLYLDGLHFSAEGAFTFRRWLGQELAEP